MDTLTHIALGACIGEAMIGKKAGKKAMLIGAVAQSLPDIDFLASFFTTTSQNLLAHRGFTHSLLFAVLVTPLIALLAHRWGRPWNVSFNRWALFFSVQAFGHVFIDAFNNYGVGWFEPFSQVRISFNAIYVADPFFSIWPILAFLLLLFVRSISKHRGKIWKSALIISGLYLGYCLYNKSVIGQDVKRSIVQQNLNAPRFFTTPAPFQSWLWYIVAESDSGFYVGYRSVFDDVPSIPYTYFPKNEHLLPPDNEEIRRLKRFSQGYYTVEKYNDTLVFNDLRFGQIIGWESPRERFAFHYFLGDSMDNILVVQRGRFAKWNEDVFERFVERVKGN